MNSSFPEVGSWFRGSNGNTFEVVAVDEEDDTIEVQHFDGTLEEFDLESWKELEIETVDAPEDWSGSMDVDEQDLPDNEEKHKDYDDPMDFVDEMDQ